MTKVVPIQPNLAISQEEADRAMRKIGSRRNRKRKTVLRSDLQSDKLIGCTLKFYQAVVRATKGRAALMLAQVIYRRFKVCKSKNVTLPTDDVVALNISRSTCRWALQQLRAAKLIRLHSIAPGTARSRSAEEAEK
jgi:DNA-binding FadR family transcriptional regulator